MDIFSDILASARLGSAVIGRAKLASPWGIAVDPIKSPALHLVLAGHCFLTLDDEKKQIALAEGDLLLVASGIGHALSNPSDAAKRTLDRVMAATPRLEEIDQSSEWTSLLCAKFNLDEVGPHPLLSFMPPLIHFTCEQIRADEPLRLAVALLSFESNNNESGYDLVASRLLDSVLVLLLRAWIKSQPLGAGGWFGALRDEGVTRALRLIHARPADPWTVASLAAGAQQSRATFARHFTRLVGEPPLSYIKKWRMNLAARSLRDGKETIEQIGLAVGYQSAPSFTQAFAKWMGQPPSTYRKRGKFEQEETRVTEMPEPSDLN